MHSAETWLWTAKRAGGTVAIANQPMPEHGAIYKLELPVI